MNSPDESLSRIRKRTRIIYCFIFFVLLCVDSHTFFLKQRERAALWDLYLLVGGNMADAFGDDLFSVFDEEPTTSSKKTSSKTESRIGYVFILY